jgi:hypothetical protein
MSREFWLCDQVRRPPAYQCSTPVLEGSVTGIHRLPNGQFGAKTTADGGQQNQSELAKNVSLQTGTSSVQNVSGERFADKPDEASVLNPQTQKEQWQSLLSVDKVQSLQVKPPQSSSPYSTRLKRPRSWTVTGKALIFSNWFLLLFRPQVTKTQVTKKKTVENTGRYFVIV